MPSGNIGTRNRKGLKGMEKAVDKLRLQLKQARQELDILHTITETISSTLDLEKVLDRIVDMVVEVSHGDACLLYLLGETGDELVLRASKNPHPRMMGKITLKVGEGITGWVAKENKPVVIERKATEDPRFKFFHNLPEDRYQAFVSMPITVKHQVVGVMNIQHKKSHRYPPNVLSLLTTIAHQVGGAIENARLYQENISAREALEARKTIERAKGVLMKAQGLSEDQAYQLLHKRSMDSRKPMKEIAEAVLLASGLLGK